MNLTVKKRVWKDNERTSVSCFTSDRLLLDVVRVVIARWNPGVEISIADVMAKVVELGAERIREIDDELSKVTKVEGLPWV